MYALRPAWPEVPLGKILTYLDERVELDDMTEYLTITVKRRHGGLEAREKLFGHQIKTKKQFRLLPRSFIISRVQCWHQAYALVPDNVPPNMIASTNYDQFAISPEVDRRFFWWLSYSPKFTETVRNSAVGVVIEKMVFDRQAWFKETIPLPPLPEQQRIVARIEALATKVEEVNGLKKDVAEETEALVVSTHLKLSGNRTRLLGEIVELDEEQVPVLPSEQYPQVGVKSFGRGLFAKSSLAGTETTYRIFNRLYSGALVLSQVKAWEGAIAICEHTLAGWYVSPEYRTFRCIPGESLPGYLSAIVRTEWFWGKLTHATRGVGARRERTRPEEFLNIRISIPEVEQQKKGEEIYRKVELLKGPEVENTVELDALLPSILDKAFKGQL